MLPASQRKPGLSCIIRSRNEAAYLADSLASYEGLLIPHEIVLVLHRSDDASREIAEQSGLPITIVEFEKEISKAGYETLATPAKHPNSLPSYSNFLFSHANYLWTFNLGGDIRLSSELVDWLNVELPFSDPEPTAVRVGCVLGDNEKVNAEQYLFNCLRTFGKHIFWEVPTWTAPPKEIEIEERTFTISGDVLKPYWRSLPWFAGDDWLDRRYQRIVELMGPEPLGMARGSNPVADEYCHLAHTFEAALRQTGVGLYL